MKWTRPEPGKISFIFDDREASNLLKELHYSFCFEDGVLGERSDNITNQVYCILAVVFKEEMKNDQKRTYRET